MLSYNQGVIKIDLFDRLELIAYDARLAATVPEKTIDPRVVIIDLDERSLVEEGHWPWNRVKLATLVNTLFEVYQVDILGFDVMFAERDSAEELELLESLANQTEDTAFLQRYQDYKPLLNPDTIFAQEMEKHQVILGYYFDKSITRSTYTGAIGEPAFAKGSPYFDMLRLQKTNQRRDAEGNLKINSGEMFEASVTSFTGNVSELESAALASGFYSIASQDIDGILRRIQLLEKYDGAIYESLSLALARNYLVGELELNTSLRWAEFRHRSNSDG